MNATVRDGERKSAVASDVDTRPARFADAAAVRAREPDANRRRNLARRFDRLIERLGERRALGEALLGTFRQAPLDDLRELERDGGRERRDRRRRAR